MTTHILNDEDGHPLLLRGVAVPYNDWVTLSDGRRERFAPGAFAAQRDAEAFCGVTAQWSHDPDSPPVASTLHDTLWFYDTCFGLLFEGHLEAHPAALGILSVVRSTGIAASIMFGGDFTARDDGTVTAARLLHVGITTPEEAVYPTAAWLEYPAMRHSISRTLTAPQLHWRRHIESAIRAERQNIAPPQAQERPRGGVRPA